MDSTVLPTGTVTLLFTDIEGSTRLWEQKPESMRLALARHDACLTAAIESCNGHSYRCRATGARSDRGAGRRGRKTGSRRRPRPLCAPSPSARQEGPGPMDPTPYF